jgi:hypothetical protein
MVSEFIKSKNKIIAIFISSLAVLLIGIGSYGIYRKMSESENKKLPESEKVFLKITTTGDALEPPILKEIGNGEKIDLYIWDKLGGSINIIQLKNNTVEVKFEGLNRTSGDEEYDWSDEIKYDETYKVSNPTNNNIKTWTLTFLKEDSINKDILKQEKIFLQLNTKEFDGSNLVSTKTEIKEIKKGDNIDLLYENGTKAGSITINYIKNGVVDASFRELNGIYDSKLYDWTDEIKYNEAYRIHTPKVKAPKGTEEKAEIMKFWSLTFLVEKPIIEESVTLSDDEPIYLQIISIGDDADKPELKEVKKGDKINFDMFDSVSGSITIKDIDNNKIKVEFDGLNGPLSYNIYSWTDEVDYNEIYKINTPTIDAMKWWYLIFTKK